MYVWMVLAVFMAAIFSFNIAPRDDMQDITKVPAAKGVAGKIMTLHSAAMSSVSEDPSFSGGDVDYLSGDIVTSTLNDYLPTGHCYNNGCTHNLSDEFKSTIYCLSNFDFQSIVSCNNGNAANFLITSGDVPKKWIVAGTNTPDSILLKAMGEISDNDENFGYTVSFNKTNPYNSSIGIRTVAGTSNAVPRGTIPAGKLVYITRLK